MFPSHDPVWEFLSIAFNSVGIQEWEDFVVVDPEFYRPAEVDYLRGDCSKAKEKLGWTPKHTFEDLVKMMVMSDLSWQEEILTTQFTETGGIKFSRETIDNAKCRVAERKNILMHTIYKNGQAHLLWDLTLIMELHCVTGAIDRDWETLFLQSL